MSKRLELADLLIIAEAILGEPAEQLARTILVSSAESALASPFATFGGIDFYPDPAERAAICCSRIVRNHPFPDGNKRVAYECMREMLERDGLPWPRPSEDAVEIADMVEGLAGRTVSEAEFVSWVQARTKL
ncbi:MAG TPA: Fic family protein [Solirubrobacterales bacterium]|jgi:death-on-curing protein|nr:Fic family protein [Solirubrobacterales bacterium]